jgi:hypothetical protein
MSERLTPDGAARIAKANGLGMPDAAALLQLADTEAEAEHLAEQFTRSQTPEALAEAVHRKMGRA